MGIDLAELPLTDWQRESLRGALEDPYYRWAGIELEDVRAGASRLRFRPRDEMRTPHDTLNGGVINSLVELPSWVALLTALEPGEFPVTNDVFLQHVRPLPGRALYALEGRLLRRGRTMAWTEVTVSVEGRPHTLVRITKTLLSGGPRRWEERG
jgi:uncharacterized protein (TIGR00369 family)